MDLIGPTAWTNVTLPSTFVSATTTSTPAPTPTRPSRVGLLLAGVSMFLIGSQAGAVPLIDDFPVAGGQALRYGVSAALLLLVARLRGLRWIGLSRREMVLVCALAATGLVLFNLTQIAAIRHSSPAVVGTVLSGLPIGLAIVAPLLAGRRPDRRTTAAAAIVSVGAAITTGLGSASPLGAVLAVLTLSCEVGFSLLAVPLVRRLGALRTSAYAALVATVLLVAIGAVLDGPAMLRMPTVTEAIAYAYIAVIVTVVAFCTWYSALGRIGPERAGLFAGMIPIGAMVTGLLTGSGAPTTHDMLGAAVVIVGVVVGTTRGGFSRRTSGPPAGRARGPGTPAARE